MGNVNMEAHQIHYKGEETAKTMFEKLDLIAQQVGDLPTFTSDDRVFLEKLPALPTAEGKTVLTAETDDQGETNLSYAAPEVKGEDVAPEFSDAEAYSAGDLVFHDGILYKFTSDHAAGDWDATEATPTSVDRELSELKNTLTDSVTNGDMRPVTSNAVYDYLNDSVSVTGSSNDTHTTLLNKLYAAIDFSKISMNSFIVYDNVFYRICNRNAMEFTVLVPYFSSAQAYFDAVKITLNSSASTKKYIRYRANVGSGEYTSPTGNVTDESNESANNKTYTLCYR